MEIKMQKDKLLLKLDSSRSFNEQREDIGTQLSAMHRFLAKGELPVAYDGLELGFFEEMELCEILDNAFGKKVQFCYKSKPPSKLMRHIEASGEHLSLDIKRTIRGGEKIVSNGDLTVTGDVNPTAVIEARGSIFVIGTLRGSAFAGTYGDEKSTIFALEMLPEQLCIANVRAYDKENALNGKAAIAKLLDGEIILENL